MFRQFLTGTLWPIINYSLQTNQWSIPLKLFLIAMPFNKLVKTNYILDYRRVQIYLKLLHTHSNLILVKILVLIIVVTHWELHLVWKWFQKKLVPHTDLLIKVVFHHFVDGICLNKFKNSVLEIVGLIPYRCWYKHFGHGVPINAQFPNFLQLDDGRWILFLFRLFLLQVCVQFDVLDGQPKRKWLLARIKVIFIANMDVLNIILDSPKQPSE